MPPIVCSRLFVWPSTIWPCTKCDRNIFSFMKKSIEIHFLYAIGQLLRRFWRSAFNAIMIWYPSSSISYDCRGHFLRHILSMLLTYSVTLAVWQSCSLACRHVIEERKCLGATPFQDFQLGLGGVVTLLLCCQGKCHGFRVILVSQTLAFQRDRSSELLCVALSFKLLLSTESNIDNGPRYTFLWGIHKKLRCAAL